MSKARRRVRGVLAGAAASVLTALAAVSVPLAPAAASPQRVTHGTSAHQRAVAASTVQLHVRDVSPSSPPLTPNALTVQLEVTNTSTTAVGKIRIDGLRGDSLVNRNQLATQLADPPSDPTGQTIRPTQTVTVDLGASQSVLTTFTTKTAKSDDSDNICLCANGVYPLYFRAHRIGDDSNDKALATATTYLPSFYSQPHQPVAVSWVWPLIDRPHRLLDDGRSSTDGVADNVFTDDDLATSVGPNGRLDRALDTVRQLESKGNFPITLLIDPDLLDELSVMQSGYTVRSGGRSVAGTGQQVARTWLDELTTLLETYSGVQVQLTPYADPDVESLHAHKLSWSASMPAQMRQRVALALPGRSLSSTVAWPSANAVSFGTLGVLADQGVRTIVVGASSITPRDGGSDGVPVGVAQLRRHSHTIAAALTDATTQRYAAAAVTRTTNTSPTAAATALPQLVSQIAIRAAQDPDSAHSLVITPPRQVDADPTAAAAAIRATSATVYSRATSLSAAVGGDRLPRKHSHARTTVGASGLPAQVLTDSAAVHARLSRINSLLSGGSRSAAQLVAALPIALQRVGSAAWVGNATVGTQFSRQLASSTRTLIDGVDILPPASGSSFTLASSNATLPVAVRNRLPYPVRVQVHVMTVNAAPGFTIGPVQTETINADDQRTIKLPAHIDRSGRIPLRVQLTTPAGQDIGSAVPLSVRNTALGVIGIVITVVAGAVLALALLFRFVSRLRMRRAKQAQRHHRSTARPPAPATAAAPGSDT